ncbi:hypothetical protein ACHRV1_07500 [Flavobacterium aquidurense]|uniref:hypothetical protein n=1 Tax=Flavobacterium aquidurense TaxID=362413 RepID=UPI00375681FB
MKTDNYCTNCDEYKTDKELVNYKCNICNEYVLSKFSTSNGDKAIKRILASEVEANDMITIPYTDDFRRVLGISYNETEALIGLQEYRRIKIRLNSRVEKLEGAWYL